MNMTRPTAEEVIAAVKGLPDSSALKSILAAGGDPNARIEGRTALDYAVTLGYEEKVRLLLSYHADPNLHEDPDPSNYGRFITPLIAATRNDERLGIIKLLLAAGANPNQCDDGGMTPLMCAATMGASGVVDLLLTSGAVPTIETPEGQTALHFAMMRDSPEIVRRLVHLGLDPTKPSARGPSPAQLAEKRNHAGALAVLTELSGRQRDV
jgi:ankyrin repeat protein